MDKSNKVNKIRFKIHDDGIMYYRPNLFSFKKEPEKLIEFLLEMALNYAAQYGKN